MRRFECTADGSAKFWEIDVSGVEHTVCFGKLGTNGQTRTKAFASEALALAHAENLIAEKTRKGYVEVATARTSSDADGDDAFMKALSDIEEWMTDNHAGEIVSNLATGASQTAIAACEARVGARFPAALRQLYLLHDGQRNRDLFPLFEDAIFTDLAFALQIRDGMLRYFGVPHGQAVDAAANDLALDRAQMCADPEAPLREEEFSLRWWPLMERNGEYVAVNLDTGRVFEIIKDTPAFVLAADSVTDLLSGYADRMWNDEYEVAGDASLDGVTAKGFVSMKKHLQKVR